MNEDDVSDVSGPSDELRDGLTALEQQEAMMAALRAAIQEGELSAPFTPLDIEAFIARMRAAKPAR